MLALVKEDLEQNRQDAVTYRLQSYGDDNNDDEDDGEEFDFEGGDSDIHDQFWT